MLKILRKVIFGFTVVFLLIWGMSLLKCEILTTLHGNEFLNAYKENDLIGDIEYLKVLSYSRDYARVYFVGEGNSVAIIICYNREDGYWSFEKWDAVWSAIGGSASEVIWPYWWHFIYGGF